MGIPTSLLLNPYFSLSRAVRPQGFHVIVFIWILMGLLIWFYFSLFFSSIFQDYGNKEVKIMSYNIWNYHSYWHTRKKGVADLIRREFPDIVLLQEVRQSARNEQIKDLQSLLSHFVYSSFAVATPNADFDSAEGMAILSRHPIVWEGHYNFSVVQSDGDRNTRTCLSAIIDTPSVGRVQVYVTHLSYEKHTQCRQFVELLNYIEKDQMEDKDCTKNIPKIVAGDFNIYADFEGPAHIFSQPLSHSHNSPCSSQIQTFYKHNVEEENSAKFRDVWQEIYPNTKGLTFSLMPFKDADHLVPSSGLESRPDRMFVKSDSCVLKETKITRNDGSQYAVDYASQIFYEQLYFYLLPFGGVWPYSMYVGPILFSLFALFRLPKFYLLFAFAVSVYLYNSFLSSPTNPDDIHPSDHLALIATFKSYS